MTQLLLFDTPVGKTFAPVTSAVRESAVREVEPTVSAIGQNEFAGQRARPAASDFGGYQRGVNQMGDLARLVLLQYDLVAQRRAKRLAKQAAANV